jgi:hypothetical protein
MLASPALSEHLRRDTRIAYGYAAIEAAQGVIGTAAVVITLFVARHNQLWMVVTPLVAASLLLIGMRPRRPRYRTHTYRLRRDIRERTLPFSAMLLLLADDVDATWGPKRITRRRAHRRRWGKQLGGIGQAAAVGITVAACSAPTEYALAASSVWLMMVGIGIKLEVLLYESAAHILTLRHEEETPCR